jgi:hypothetical protein
MLKKKYIKQALFVSIFVCIYNQVLSYTNIPMPEDCVARSCLPNTTTLIPKHPALLVSLVNTPPIDSYAINGIAPAVGSRILLVNQTDSTENGLWVVQSGPWSRPSDFLTGTQACSAYVSILMTSQNNSISAAWICISPSAVIDTDPLFFLPVSMATPIQGENVGLGVGQIFKDKTSSTLNFKTIAVAAHLVATNNTNEVILGTDATSSATPDTIVSRDASGKFNINNLAIQDFSSSGVVHNDASGELSSSLITNNDIDISANIADTKLATITSAGKVANSSTTATSINAANAIVMRDASGNFDATNIRLSSLGSVGVVHSDPFGALSTSRIVNDDIDLFAAIADTKLATISTPGKVANSATTASSMATPNAIVTRDPSGNFTANTITASLTGNASMNVLKAGDIMNGNLTIPAGTASNPSLNFAGSTNTGISAGTGNTLSLSTLGIERIKINETNTIITTPCIITNKVCFQAIQSITPTTNGSVICNSTTTILLLKHSSNITNFTVRFPPNPANGQLFTILLGTTNTITLNNVGGTGGASIVNQITGLNPSAGPNSTANGCSVTYFYSSAANTWYRLHRG